MRQKAENKSGLSPCGRAVLVEPYEPEVQRGRIAIPETVSERTRAAEMRAIVIAVGPECWKGEEHPRAEPGDKVLVARYAGIMCRGTADGRQYRVVNENDIFLRITDEAALLKEVAV